MTPSQPPLALTIVSLIRPAMLPRYLLTLMRASRSKGMAEATYAIFHLTYLQPIQELPLQSNTSHSFSVGRLLVAAFVLACTAAHAGDGYGYQTLSVEGAISTMPSGISGTGTIVGTYQFERGPDLLIRPFSFKDGVYTLPDPQEPAAFSFDDVNDANHVVSNVSHRDFATEAFFGDRNRRTLLAVPGAIGTQAYGLSDRDVVVGAYEHDPDALGIATTSAFAWHPRTGYRTFDVPGSAGLTVAWDVNRAGTSVGVYVDADGVYHGFIRDRSGAVKTVDVPGSPYTQLMGINDTGAIVGFFQDPADFNLRGFVLQDGRFARLSPPDDMNGSYPYRITDDGRIVGFSVDANYRSIGFLATPVGR